MLDCIADCRGKDITILDFLAPAGVDGCRWFVGSLKDLRDLTPDIFTCILPIFPKQPNCTFFRNDLTLAFSQFSPEIGQTDMAKNLVQLGLSKIVQVDGDLNIFNFGTSTSQGLPLGDMQFFPDLRRAHRINLRDNNVQVGQQPMFSSMSGFQNLEQVDVLQITSQGFSNLLSFAGLKCVATGIAILNNPTLATLDGLSALEDVGYNNAPGNKTIITDNPKLVNVSAFAPLKGAAHCPGPNSKNPADRADPIRIKVGSCNAPIVTWAMLCDFLADATCPPQSQPPAPPRPPSPSPPPAPPSLCPLLPLTQSLKPGKHLLSIGTSK
jgi:hypothetical protein